MCAACAIMRPVPSKIADEASRRSRMLGESEPRSRTVPISSAIIATASLAGIIPFPPDPCYDASKHAVVGFIRSVAQTLAPQGILANTVNPGMTDTNILNAETKDFFASIDFPLMPAEQIAQAIVDILEAGRYGECWVCQPGRESLPYRFGSVPGPRGEAAGRIPPNGLRDWATGRDRG